MVDAKKKHGRRTGGIGSPSVSPAFLASGEMPAPE
jgi:hypothetical protein